MKSIFKNNSDTKSSFRILKNGKISLVVSALLGSVQISFAAPSDGVVTSGSAHIVQNGSVTNINQSSSKASINWRTFSIASGETVNFNQPNVNSITLNRIIGNEKSIINGALNANGQVWLLNSNGVLFGKNARVNTAGILASTKKLSDDDFNSDNYIFKGNSQESVINLGEIDITDSGYAALLASNVSNEGTIKAVRGKVHLVGAEEVSISLNGNSLVELTVKRGVLDALVENKGAIYATGGEIYLTTNAVDELLKGVVNNTGIVEAQSFDDITGKIELFAHGGEVKVDGTLKAESGFIETSGKEFKVSDSAIIKAKQWLIDPVDITIESTGSTSDLAGSSIKASFIESTLNSGTGVTLSATNDINVNENISWTDALFTLDAENDININAIITASGTAGLTMNGNVLVGFNDGEATGFKGRVDLSIADIIINGNTYKVLTSLGSQGSTTSTDLQGMAGNLSGNYVLGSNIDATATSTWNSDGSGGFYGFDPIGDSWNSEFDGNFDGLGHTISNLYINRSNEYNVGLFSVINAGSISNIGLTSTQIDGEDNVAGLAGYTNGNILNSYTTGNVTGKYTAGGLIGGLGQGNISNAYSTADVTGTNNMGGLVGSSYYGATISNSYSKGKVTGEDAIGGLVGYASNTDITDTYATGEVSGKNNIGGLTGNFNGEILNSYATGKVTGLESNTGGLVGRLDGYGSTPSIKDSYAIGIVNGDSYVGGLVGSASSGTIINSHTTADVTGNSYVGGLAGDGKNITTSYSTGNVFGTQRVGGLIGRLTDFGTISNSHATGDVKATGTGSDDYIGGLVGSAHGDISNSYATGDIEGDDYIGGLVGHLEGKGGNDISISSSSYASGKVTGLNDVGGLVGRLFSYTDGYGSASVISSYSENSEVIGSYSVGGLVGKSKNGSTISSSYSTTTVAGISYIGGLVGLNDNSITKYSYSTGAVTGVDDAGGLVGRNDGSIESSYATGSVNSGTSYAGGLVADNYDGIIKNSYATGTVTGTDDIGGLVGYHGGDDSLIENSYAIGLVTGVSDTGGLIGYNYGTINNSYYDKTVNVGMNDEATHGKSTIELKDASTFITPQWSIEKDVNLAEGTPILTMTGTTPIWKIYAASNTAPTSNPTPDQKAEKAVTSIVNKVSITPPVIQKTSTQNFTSTKINFGNKTDKVTVVSKPLVGEKTKKVSQSEVKEMQGSDTTIVPIGRNALVQLIDSGVTLPEGVEQEFYVVDDKRR